MVFISTPPLSERFKRKFSNPKRAREQVFESSFTFMLYNKRSTILLLYCSICIYSLLSLLLLSLLAFVVIHDALNYF